MSRKIRIIRDSSGRPISYIGDNSGIVSIKKIETGYPPYRYFQADHKDGRMFEFYNVMLVEYEPDQL